MDPLSSLTVRPLFRVQENRAHATGVEGDDVLVFFYVKAPKGAILDLAAGNGPMTLRDLHATITTRLANGPLSLSGVHGTVDVEATTGPVSVRDGSGDWTLRVTNGPLSARLAGARWEGKGLLAEAVNGPFTVRLDPRFDSGLRVSAAAWAPVRCRAAACSAARRTGGDEGEGGKQSLQFGSGEPLVRLSTVNGPVTIKDDDAVADGSRPTEQLRLSPGDGPLVAALPGSAEPTRR